MFDAQLHVVAVEVFGPFAEVVREVLKQYGVDAVDVVLGIHGVVDVEVLVPAFLARLADGAMRDALSLLDQCGSEGRIDAERVISAIGLAGNEDTKKLFSAARNGDIGTALTTVDTLYKNGKDMSAIIDELLSLARDILIYKLSPENCSGLISGVFDIATITQLSKGLATSQPMHWLEILKNT